MRNAQRRRRVESSGIEVLLFVVAYTWHGGPLVDGKKGKKGPE
jgi:hypothetical protein